MKLPMTAGLCLLLGATAVFADDYRCVQGELVRRIQIVYEPGMAVPCEVHYYKDTESPGAHEVLWTAQNQSGYCEARTEELVAKLRSYGWTCDAAAAEPDAGDAPQADDTEALEPADEQ